MQSFEGRRPDIEYPCSWTYRVICLEADDLRRDVARLVENAVHTLAHVGESTSGRYQRLELIVEVSDEAHRNRIFQALGEFPGVRFVL